MTTPTSKKFIGATLISVMALSACSTDMSRPSGRASAQAKIGAAEAQINEDASRLQRVSDTGRPSNLRVRDGLYLGQDGFRTGRGDPLPRRLETDDGISINMSKEVSLREFSMELRRITGLRVDYRDVSTAPSMSPTSQSDGDSPDSGADSTTTLRDVAAGNLASNNQGNNSQVEDLSDHPLDIKFRADYTGPLSGLLDQVATRIGADWEYRGGRIKFLGPQTVTYTIWALPGVSQASSTIGGGGSADVFGGSSPATTSRTISSDYWSSLEAGLQDIVPEFGARYSVNKASGTIVVTAFQNVHDRIADFVERENGRLSRQVAIKVDVLAFTSEEGDTRATNFNIALENAAAGLSFGMETAPNDLDGAANFGVNVIDTDSSLSGSSALIRALANQGNISVLNSASVIATNNTPTPFSIVTEQAYLAGSSTTIDESGAESTELETGIVNSGINMVVTPRVLSSGTVNIDYTLNISELKGIETYESEDASVQLPEIDTRNFMQNLNMDSGDTMVIASYDGSRADRSGSGPFDPRLWGLGGNDSYRVEDTKIVILMTPVVVEKQNAPRARH